MLGEFFNIARFPLFRALSGMVALTARSAEPGGAVLDGELQSPGTHAGWQTPTHESGKSQVRPTQTDEQLAGLQKSLALANSETELFKRQAKEMKQRLEAMGMEGVSGNTPHIEQRLLKAVNDLKLVEDERKVLRGALVRLSEAIARYQKVAVTTDADVRGSLEAEMRNATKALGVSALETKDVAAASATLQDGTIVSIKEELGLVVANVGTRHGVKVGMPFQVIRADASVGTVRVVDVRERIAGAVIEESRPEAGRIQFGDRLKVIAQQ